MEIRFEWAGSAGEKRPQIRAVAPREARYEEPDGYYSDGLLIPMGTWLDDPQRD